MPRLRLGTSVSGAPYDIDLYKLYHAVVIGPTRIGKSTFLKTFAQSLMMQHQRQSVILLEPGGGVSEELEAWMSRVGLRDRLILFNPETWGDEILAWNVLARQGQSLSVQAKRQAEALLAAMDLQGEDSTFHMPMLRKSLYEALMAASEMGLPLTALEHLTDVSDSPYRQAIIGRLQTASTKRFWQGIEALKPAQRKDLLGVIQARLSPVLATEVVRRILNQRERSIDLLRDVITPGNVMLCSLNPYTGALSREDMLLLGNLLVQATIAASASRPPKTGTHAWLLVDEASNFVTEETGVLMRESGKYHLHGLWATQSLADFEAKGDIVRRQILTNAAKIVFGDALVEDLEYLAKEMFTEELDTHQVKDEIKQTKFWPDESRREVHTSSHAWGQGSATSRSTGASSGQTIIPDPNGGILATGITHDHAGASDMQASSDSEFEMWGEVVSSVPWYEMIPFQEVSSREYYSLEELIHERIAALKRNPSRWFALKLRHQPVQFVQVPHSPDMVKPTATLEPLRRQQFQQQRFFGTITQADQDAITWQQELLIHSQHAHPAIHQDPDDFSIPLDEMEGNDELED